MVKIAENNFCYYSPDDSKYNIGSCRLDFSEDLCYIGSFEIMPCLRNRGHGQTMLDEILKTITELGIKKVALDVLLNNKRAIHIYMKAGFNFVKEGETRMEKRYGI